MAKRNVAVLMGGTSSERDISLSTGRQILGALDPAKYRYYAIDSATGKILPGCDGSAKALTDADGAEISTLARLPEAAPDQRPDVAIIALHGKGGEDGVIQGFLETVGIPYTGSGVLASALALDKARSKTFLSASGILMPAGVNLGKNDPRDIPFPLPAVVKPAGSGSSDGLTIVSEGGDLGAAIELGFQYDDTILIEEFVQGTEITCAVLGNDRLEALPVIEIIPAKGVYDREAKYTPGATDEICPARLSADVTQDVQEIAIRCHRALGCRGMSRTDMIISGDGRIYVLEVNTIPGMTPTSLLPRAASVAGYTFSQLLDRLIDLALEK
ncbi:MAG: D-alanine--D-alanine ligase [Capsulimonadaceae bacterium]|nr:D-alanine--D-alanine ligase [Capsulimonadaceae bacterium]